MPDYIYKAKSIEGKEEKGEIFAVDQSQLAKSLHSMGLILINAKEKKEKKGISISFSFFGKVPMMEKIIFTKNLQIMVSAGLSLPRAIGTLATQTKNVVFKKALDGVGEDIRKGENFSSSLAKYPNIFSDLYKNMIKVAEESGTLEKVLGILADQMEKQHDLKTKVKGAMIYPLVILSAMTGIGILMLIVVVPKLAATFKEVGVQLPVSTRIVMGLGEFVTTKWYIALAVLFVVIFGITSSLKTKLGKKASNFVLLYMPAIGMITKKTNAAYTARTLGSLLASGVPIVRSLEIVSGTLTNSYFKAAILDSVEKVRKGTKFSEALKEYDNLYPRMMIQMIEVGEETGQTSEVLSKVASFFEDSVSEITKNMASIIEPFLMIIIGGFVAFFAISMFQPMYSMMNSL